MQGGSTPQRIDQFFDSRGQAERLAGARGVWIEMRRFLQYQPAQERGAVVVVWGRTELLAHSMGGAISVRCLQSGRPSLKSLRAAVLSSPMLGIRGLAGLSARIGPCQLADRMVWRGKGAEMHTGGKPWMPQSATVNDLSHSAVRSQRMIDLEQAVPAIRLGSPSWGWRAQSCDATRAIAAQAGQVLTPVRVQVIKGARLLLAPLNAGSAQAAKGPGGQPVRT